MRKPARSSDFRGHCQGLCITIAERELQQALEVAADLQREGGPWLGYGPESWEEYKDAVEGAQLAIEQRLERLMELMEAREVGAR